jgi:hypothetical protein
MGQILQLIEMESCRLSDSAIRILRFANVGYSPATGTAHIIYGDPVDQLYEPRLIQPAHMRRDAFSQGRTGGAVQTNYGEMILANADGGLDYLQGYAFDGRRFRYLVGEEGTAYDDLIVALNGVMELALFDLEKITFRIRDRAWEFFQKPVQPNLYLGNNSGGNGIEGTSELQGVQKPLLMGELIFWQPVLVNASKLIYQFQDETIMHWLTPSITPHSPYDGAAVLAAGSPYSSQADMETNAPPAGTYRTWIEGGCFRLGSAPALALTYIYYENFTHSDWVAAGLDNRTVGAWIYFVLKDRAALSDSEIEVADLANLIGTTPSIAVGEGWTIGETLNQLCQADLAWWGFDRAGKFRCRTLEVPFIANSIATFTDIDILEIETAPTNDENRGVPAYQVKAGAMQSHYVHSDNQIAGSASTANKAIAKQRYYYYTTPENSAVKTKHPGSQVLNIMSTARASGAAYIALLAANLFGTERRIYNVKVFASLDTIAIIDIGATVTIDHSRFYPPKHLLVLGIAENHSERTLDMTLWG